jgi:uncharacterized protein (DUF885 family)
MRLTRFAVLLLIVFGGSTWVAARPQAPTESAAQNAFGRVLQDVNAYRARGFTLARPDGVPARYSRRMEDVSEARFQSEAAALAAFASRLAAIDRQALSPATRTDAEILSRQLRDRLGELRFRAFEIPIGSREGFHFDLPALPDRSNFDTIGSYDDYIARLQSFQEHVAQGIVMMRTGLTSGRTLPRAVLDGYDAPVAAQIVSDVTTSPLHSPGVCARGSRTDPARWRGRLALVRDAGAAGVSRFSATGVHPGGADLAGAGRPARW